MLYMGKEQSKTFDAVIASHSIVMLRYLLLVYIINKSRIFGPIGPLFREISEEQTFLFMAEKMWSYVKELIIKSSQILCHEIDPDTVMHIIDITENYILAQGSFVTAKL